MNFHWVTTSDDGVDSEHVVVDRKLLHDRVEVLLAGGAALVLWPAPKKSEPPAVSLVPAPGGAVRTTCGADTSC